MRIPYGKGLQLYNNSPPLVQNTLGLLLTLVSRSTMLGSGFNSFMRELGQTQWYDKTKLKQYQESRLRALVRHAYRNIPYYYRLFNKMYIAPDDIKTTEDLLKIPVLDKDTLRKNFKDLIASNARYYNFGIGYTSGSTGKPVTFYLDQQNREIEYASVWRQREWAGIKINDKVASFRAFRALRGVDFRSGKPLWKYNALSKELEFNIFALNSENLGKQVRKLKAFNPHLITGYPSTIEVLSKYVLDHNIRNISPIAIQTSSESLSTRRDAIEEALNCKIFDWYAQSEYVVSAGQCPEGSYHAMESGLMEFLKDNELVSEGELGEIVGTRLYNYSMPLLRYRTTDLGRYSKETCKCGRSLLVVQSIEGRLADSMITPDGTIITGMTFEHYWKHEISPFTPNVQYVHVIQKADERLIIKLVKSKSYSENETVTILKALFSLMGPNIKVEFEELDSIPEQTKWRFSESELKINLT